MNQAYLQGLMKLISNPETKDLINDPGFMQKMQACLQNPALLSVYMQQDPRIKKAFDVISQDAGQNFDFESMMQNMGGAPPSRPPPKEEQPREEPAPKKE